jgi:N4-gp56 family major capsid protein
MATLSTATSGFSTLVQEVVGKSAEAELRAKLPHTIPGNYRPAQFIKGTNLVRLARYADLASQTTALTEGTAPTAQSLTIASEAFSATQVGGVLELTDLAQLDSPHDLIAINAERAGRQAAKTIDELVREVISAGASVQYVTATSRATLATSNVVTAAQVKKMVARLKRTDVPTFGDGYYRAIVHPDVIYDLQIDTATGAWLDIKYTDANPMMSGEIGRFAGVRFIESSFAKVFVDGGASSADVYSTYFFGPDSYTLADSQNLTSYFIAPGGDHSDPIAQKAAIGWKVRFGAMLVDEAGPRYIRLESGATLGL